MMCICYYEAPPSVRVDAVFREEVQPTGLSSAPAGSAFSSHVAIPAAIADAVHRLLPQVS